MSLRFHLPYEDPETRHHIGSRKQPSLDTESSDALILGHPYQEL